MTIKLYFLHEVLFVKKQKIVKATANPNPISLIVMQ